MTFRPSRLELSLRAERTLAALFITVIAVIRIAYIYFYRVDSDETQHLHVVWGWAHGLLPYRDLFDNHSPLFQYLCSPFLRWLGERADIVVPMRWLVLPLYLFSLWCVYRIGTILFLPRLALWAVILTAAYPPFLVKATEFRTDDLWALLWLLAILAIISRPLRLHHGFLAGLALGAAFSTSMKTSALALCLTIAAVAILAHRLISGSGPAIPWKRLLSLVAVALAGAIILPAAVLAYFAGKGALPNLYYCVIQHNLVSGFVRLDAAKRLQLFAAPAILCIVGGAYSVRWTTNSSQRDRVALIAVTGAVLSLLLGLCWPIIEPHDLLPLAPLVVLAALPAFARLFKMDGAIPGRGLSSFALPLLAATEIVILLVSHPPRVAALNETNQIISDVLRLTTPDDYVMDAKGESVFRRRAIYPVLEGVTLHRYERGLLKDDIPEQLLATRAPVATILRTPPRGREFIEHNYLPVAYRIRVLGQMVVTDDAPFSPDHAFQISIPASYTLMPERGNLDATVDDQVWAGPRSLSAGWHQVKIGPGNGRIALVWTPAAQKGYSPFSPNAKDVAKAAFPFY